MPFVDAVWNGQCADRKIQQELCEQLLRVSDLSSQKFKSFFGKPSNPVLYDDPDQEAEYLVCESVFTGRVPTSKLNKVDNGIYLAKKLSLYGVEFPLFDPRFLNPPFFMGTNDRMSFVFTRSCEPELDGLLAQTFPVNNQHVLCGLCSQVLDTPALGVRDGRVAWMSELLGWVKHFFIPNLNYWIPGENSRDSQHQDLGRDQQNQAFVFEKILMDFLREEDRNTCQESAAKKQRDLITVPTYHGKRS